jgi:hypothetical protein
MPTGTKGREASFVRKSRLSILAARSGKTRSGKRRMTGQKEAQCTVSFPFVQAKQDQERQKLQQKQDQDHQRLEQQKSNEAKKQQVEQHHQQQTQQLVQKHAQQQQQMQQRQQPAPHPSQPQKP